MQRSFSHLVLPLLIALLLLVSFRSLAQAERLPQTRSSPTTSNVNWPQFGYNPAHSRYNPFEKLLTVKTVRHLSIDWQASLNSYGINSSPVVAGGYVYIGSSNGIAAFDASTGTPLWSANTGGSVEVAPAVVNGVIYVASDYANLSAYNATTGARLWTTPLNADETYSAPMVANGFIYISWEVGYLIGALFAFRASTGQLVWQHTFNGPVFSTPAISNGVVYLGSGNNDSNLYAFAARTGAILWHADAPTTGLYFSPSIAQGVVYVSYKRSDQLIGQVIAYNAKTGQQIWATTGGTGFNFSSPALAYGMVYVGSGDSHLYAYDARTGAERWAGSTGDQIFSSPSVANGVVYVGSLDNNLYAFNATNGAFLQRVTTGAPIENTSPAIVNGIVYIGSDNGNLYAMHVPGSQ